jgi:hypothetical protein
MSQLKKTIQATPNRANRNLKRNQSPLLASVTLDTSNTMLVQEDIFNEPSRERLDFTGAKWVRFFTQKDDFLKSLIAIVNNSPTLRRIIEDKVNMVVGDGFIPMKGKSNTLLTTSMKGEVITDDSLNDIEEVIGQVNLHSQNLQEVLGALAFDYDAFGNCFAEIVRGKVGSQPFTYIYHVPVYNIGIRKAEADQIIRSIGIYDNWEEVPLTTEGTYYENEGFREIPIYPEFKKLEDGTERSIIHVKQYAAGYFYFGLPEWIGAKMWAEMEYRIQRFNTSKFENGFMPSGILQFFGSMTQTEAKSLVEGIESKFTGMGNNHKLFVQILRDEKLKANWIPTSKENEGEFLNLQNLAASAIVVANRWSKSLAGFATSGQLGTNQQIRQEMEYLQNTVIKPRQNLLLSKIINPFLNEISAYNPAFVDVTFGISNTLPVSFMGDIAVEQNLSMNEKREILGYSPIEIETTTTPTNEPTDTTE